ncbi:MAG: PBP1A family penicillin-binding protein [Coriobacteriia bacterium]|jgi:penicillin-binding protein 1A|nr:PBP1A family penicillin-binding protein [Coriobacteriia bacterium]
MNERDRNSRRTSGDVPNQRPKPKPRPRRGASGTSRQHPPRAARSKPSRRRPATSTQRTRQGSSSRRVSARPARVTRRRRARRFALISLVTAAVALVVVGIGAYASIVRNLPDPEGNAKGRDQTSVIYDRNGKELAKLFAEQNRTDRPLAEIPESLRKAVVATEDRRFYEHQGVDPLGIARALWTDVRMRSTQQGGSTITQQYVKNAFVTPERTLSRKVSEAILAYRIEKNTSKDRILELYLNTIYFGHGAYGVEAAAHAYFGKDVTELDLAESAMIAGVIKSPGRYSPYLDPQAATDRRATVLRQMADQGMISEEDRTQAAEAEFALAGLESDDAVAPYFIEYIKAQLADDFGADTVFRGGIGVNTTLDLSMQRAAEDAIAGVLDREDDPSAALIAIDPRTGEILAMVGGRDFATQQFNVAVQGQGRQPGSSFKPFVFVTALQEGVTAEQTFDCGPAALSLPNGQTWKVTGASGGRTGPMRLREAMEKSVNSVFARLILDVGPPDVVETAHAMGIMGEITPVPAIALGGHEQGVTPLEMASAYGTLAAGGDHAKPFSITSVKSSEGEVLQETSASVTRVLDPAVAYLTTDVLRGVISRGTGTSADIGRPAAGKTGTTQKYRDAWFVGYTPDLVTAVWVGYPEGQREMTDVHGKKVTGGSFPAEIWATFMRAALADRPSTDFKRPAGLVNTSVCRESGGRSTQWCENTFQGLFLSDNQPSDCPIHTGPKSVTLPELVGLTKERALAQLAETGLKASVAEEEVAGVAVGIVARQDPAPGTVADVGSTVHITVSTGVKPPPPPTASFSVTPAEPAIDQIITFDGASSKGQGGISLYLWEFGDGSEAEGVKVTHTFTAPGTYNVVLWVTDANDQTSSAVRQVLVR